MQYGDLEERIIEVIVEELLVQYIRTNKLMENDQQAVNLVSSGQYLEDEVSVQLQKKYILNVKSWLVKQREPVEKFMDDQVYLITSAAE